MSPELYWQLWPGTVLLVLANGLQGLYPGFGTNPVEELRRTSASVSLVHLVAGAATFVVRGAEVYSRAVFLVAWLLALVLVPVGRAAVRHVFCRSRWWGYPVLALGAGETGRLVTETLRRQPGIGLRPVALLDDDPDKHGRMIDVPVAGGLDLAPVLARDMGIRYAILAMPGVARDRLVHIIEQYGHTFHHLLVIPDLFGMSSLWVTPRDLGGTLGLEVRQTLLLPWPRRLKRLLDLVLIVASAPVLLPLVALLAVLIRMDSPGPAFYAQDRVGRGGHRIRVWKFRTMVQDADRVLERLLAGDPKMRAEWEHDHKLRDDPRLTRIGRFLRRTSLDELPQVWNVLRGEMSLVGPRPIVQEEVKRYGERFTLYAKVTPGMTGLWQVSGRSDTSYAERVALDTYYVRNWSVWLDLYILARTLWAVPFGRGAY
ncbi:MAG: undecaprenyl-phosphate galactose phosphotransferase WbaP [Armatimonadota bacterium]|nr:undecaprenyl-phosphate galactose phosphotransferase WbaP [Armatimonadota bacterium]